MGIYSQRFYAAIELKLLVLYLPDANAYCAEFADYRNVIYSALRVGLYILSIRQTSTFPFPVHCYSLNLSLFWE